MNRLTKLSAILALATTLAAPAFAGHGARGGAGEYYDYGKVTAVEPIVEEFRVEIPVKECWQETVYRRERHGYRGVTPEIVGGIVGAAVGNQFGRGRGRDVATVAGALLGGSIAHDIKRGRQHEHVYAEPIERCEVRSDFRTEQRVVGYHVTYRYHGRTYHTRMDDDPGNRVRVRVTVATAE